MTLWFSNPGEIDMDAAITLGVNAKVGDSPFGQFGTGLKYSIAGVLARGGKLTIYSGVTEYVFTTVSRESRGTAYSVVLMNGQPTGFTTHLGSHWKEWQLVRELACNARDEGGDYFYREVLPAPGTTVIVLDCPEIEAEIVKVFITSAPLCPTIGIDIHPSTSRLFYRGVFVCDNPFSTGSLLFDYNIFEKVDLTEDRTFRSVYTVRNLIQAALHKITNPEIIRRLLTVPELMMEHSLTFAWSECSPELREAAEELYRTRPFTLHPSFRATLLSRQIKDNGPTPPSELQRKMISRALAFLEKIGVEVVHPIEIREMRHGVLGAASGNVIHLSPAVFGMGTKMVAGTIFEEHLHLTHGFEDMTRRFQDYLINFAMSLGETISGDPV